MNRYLIAATLSLLAAGHALAQGPARYDIVAQCPGVAQQLPEQLASLKNEVGTEGTVRVLLVVGADGVQRIESIEGPRRYQSRVRSSLQGLDCRSDEPRRYVLNIRFGDEPVSSHYAADSKPR